MRFRPASAHSRAPRRPGPVHRRHVALVQLPLAGLLAGACPSDSDSGESDSETTSDSSDSSTASWQIAAEVDDPDPDQSQLAGGMFGPLGDVRPNASALQVQQFERGHAVATRVFRPENGLGPLFNVTTCADCHEKPLAGGSAPRYRDFALTGTRLSDDSFIAGTYGGVLTRYGLGEAPTRPTNDAMINVSAVRSAIPFFGVGAIAELEADTILVHEDPDDEDGDGDGISGRANWDRGFVGRFGRKSQTLSIEGFIRGPLNNHVGITSDPLPDHLEAQLPVPSNLSATTPRMLGLGGPPMPCSFRCTVFVWTFS